MSLTLSELETIEILVTVLLFGTLVEYQLIYLSAA